MLDCGVMYDEGMINNDLTDIQEAFLTEWLTDCGYSSPEDWAADSDYVEDVENAMWLDEDGNEVDPTLQAWYALEAAAEAGDQDAEALMNTYEAGV